MGKTKDKHALGQVFMKQQMRERTAARIKDYDEVSGFKYANNKSVTEESSISEFFNKALLANKDFAATRPEYHITSQNVSTIPENTDTNVDVNEFLRIPRRPTWDQDTTPEQLNDAENISFLDWRRELAIYQENSNRIVTPYEKNLDLWRQLWRVVERSDVVVQIVDARNPLLYYCSDLDAYCKQVNSKKSTVLLLNKSDFLTSDQRSFWADYFCTLNVHFIFWSAQTEIEKFANKSSEDVENEDSSEFPLINSTQLIKTIEDLYNPNHNDEHLTIGFVGYPNVGKSSTINALIHHKGTAVSSTPGKTKHFQTFMLTPEICICDCPGLVFPQIVLTKADLLVNGVLPVDEMRDHISPINYIVKLVPWFVFSKIYGLNLPNEDHLTGRELLEAHGSMRGFMTQRGIADTSRSARSILKDFVKGKILYCWPPPGISSEKFSQFSSSSKTLLSSSQSKNAEDFDKDFFSEKFPEMHVKGKSRLNSSASAKPWKNHQYKRNRKEKLRRIYKDS